MNLTARMSSVVSCSSSLRKTWYGYQDLGKSVVVDDDRSGQLDRLSPAGYSKLDYGRSWSSQECESEVTAHDRSGKPEKTSWDTLQKVAPHREEPFLDGNALSVRYGETIHDGSVKPETVDHQEEANFETFVMGSDAAKFVNKVKDQVRKRQKRMSNVADSGEEHAIGNVYGCDDECGDIHGKEFLNCSKFRQELWRSHVETDVRCHRAVGEWSGRNQWPGQNSVGKEFLETSVIDWWRNSYQFSAHKSLCLLRFCCVLEGFINILNPTKLGRKGLKGSRLTKVAKTKTESMESRLNSSGTFHQHSLRCSSAVKSQIYWAD